MFSAQEQLPVEEALSRRTRCLHHLQQLTPTAGGLLLFSPLNIYYFTGAWGGGILWLPHDGLPVLCSPVPERARLESPLAHIMPLSASENWATLLEEAEQPLSDVVAVEMSFLSWSHARTLAQALPHHQFLSGDRSITLTRAIKSPWEQRKMLLAGQRHHTTVHDILPGLLHTGLSERDIGILSWKLFWQQGHGGLNRLSTPGEDIFLGHIAAGDNGNFPSHFNGPLGVKGEHPAIPYMGDPGSIWKRATPLALDIGFVLEGYHTDKTQVYWAGTPASLPDEVRRAQDAAQDIEQRAAEALRPGVLPSTIWRDACRRAEALGVAEGFMGLGRNKVRFLGHGIGLVIDEYPVIAERFDSPLEAGMTLALEPKIGLPGIGMVGVENTFIVTPEGGRCITGAEHWILFVER